MRRKLFGGMAIVLLAGGLSLASMTSAEASGAQSWTQTSCNYNGGNISYTYTSAGGSTVTTAASVGGSFFGTETALIQAVAKKYTESEK